MMMMMIIIKIPFFWGTTPCRLAHSLEGDEAEATSSNEMLAVVYQFTRRHIHKTVSVTSVSSAVTSPKSSLVNQTFNCGPIMGTSLLSWYFPPVEKQLPGSSWVVNSNFLRIPQLLSKPIGRPSVWWNALIFSHRNRYHTLVPLHCLDWWGDENVIKLCRWITMPNATTGRHFRKTTAWCLVTSSSVGATGRGGPWPPLQYASRSLGPLLCLSIRLYPSFSGPWTSSG